MRLSFFFFVIWLLFSVSILKFFWLKLRVWNPKRINIKTVILCDDQDAPGQKFSDDFVCGNYDDEKKINEFVEKVDIVTFEFENIPFETLNKINETKKVLPKPSINKIIQHRI